MRFRYIPTLRAQDGSGLHRTLGIFRLLRGGRWAAPVVSVFRPFGAGGASFRLLRGGRWAATVVSVLRPFEAGGASFRLLRGGRWAAPVVSVFRPFGAGGGELSAASGRAMEF
jgi:hypothetical protein